MSNQKLISLALLATLCAPTLALSGCVGSDDAEPIADDVAEVGALYDDSQTPADDKADGNVVCEWTNDGASLKNLVTYKTFALSAAFNCYAFGGVALMFGPQSGAIGCAIGVGRAAVQSLAIWGAGKAIELACTRGKVRGTKASIPMLCDRVPENVRNARPQLCL